MPLARPERTRARLRPARLATAATAVALAAGSARPACAMTTMAQTVESIIPAPSTMSVGSGRFTIDANTRIVIADPGTRQLHDLAEYLAVPLRAATGFALPVSGNQTAVGGDGVIALALTGNAAATDRPYDWADRVPENYSLDVTTRRITLTAATPAGLFRGLQTLRQLMPPAFEDAYAATHGLAWRSDESAVTGANRSAPGGSGATNVVAPPSVNSSAAQQREPAGQADWSIPALSIDDAPRFAWRGMHLDVGRHIFTPAFIRKYIDLIAAHRMNVFHWHLTEDQGWRIDIAKYPRLTDIGAYRNETILERNFSPYVGDGIPYGGFYTQEQIRDIVDYAASRYVTIVPEIEMPGHSVAALAAYPELGCSPGPFEVATVWGVMPDIFCPHERTFSFLEDVLTEVMALFPGRYIHIGGDEAPKTAWEQSDVAQDIIRLEKLADEHELQSWFIRRIERFLSDNDRRLVGWDEILEGGLAPEATVMSWRGMQGGVDAARQGHDVVMTPNSHAYFDYYQGEPASEPLANGGLLPLERVYSFEPVPAELTAAETIHVLGAQANVWTEYIKTADHVEYMAVPRMLALAEVAWSPVATRDWTGFLRRLTAALDRLDRLGVDYRVPDVFGLETDRLTLGDTVHVTLTSPAPGATVRYTLDGTDPTASSTAYMAALTVPVDANGLTVSARSFTPDGRASAVSRARFAKATLREPDLADRTGLSDGLRYEYFEGNYRSADDVREMEPLRTDVATAVALKGGEREERFALRLTGYVHAREDGIHTFTLSSDDGSRLRIGGDLVIDHDGLHGPSELAGQIALAAGWHSFEITYFQAGGGRSLDLHIAPPARPSIRLPLEAIAFRP